MAQLPLGWNPGDSTPRTRPSPPPDEPLTVSELSTSIVEALERLPSTLRVRGESSNLSTRSHWYFSLKDEHALIGCVMWSSRTRGVESVPAEGDEVEVSGHIAHYAPQGRTQFIVERLRPAGAGALRARFEALCAELREAGWFEEDRKQPLPLLPRPPGAAAQRCFETLRTSQRHSVAPRHGRTAAARLATELAVASAVSRAGAYVCMGQIRLFLPRFGPFFHRFFAVFSRCPASWRQDGENAPKTAENGRKMAEIVVPQPPKSYVYPCLLYTSDAADEG